MANGRKPPALPDDLHQEPWEPEEPKSSVPYTRKSMTDHDRLEIQRLQEFEKSLYGNKPILDQMAELTLKLTYGEMTELVKGLKDADTEKVIPDNPKGTADIIHLWAVKRLSKNNGKHDENADVI